MLPEDSTSRNTRASMPCGHEPAKGRFPSYSEAPAQCTGVQQQLVNCRWGCLVSFLSCAGALSFLEPVDCIWVKNK